MDPLLTILLTGAIALVSAVQVLLAWILNMIWREISALRERVHRIEGGQAITEGVLRTLGRVPRQPE